jgi:hypothetical protein
VMTVALVLTVADRRVGAAAMILFLSLSSWIVYNGYEVADSIGRARQHVLLDAFDRLRKMGVDASCVLVDNAPKPPGWHLANYKFLVPTSDFETIDAAPAGCGPLLLSASPQIAARFPGARPVSYENYVPLGLWVVVPHVSAAVRDALATSGLLGPLPVTAAFPTAAYRSSMTLVVRKAITTQLRLLVQLTHTGSGAPWPGSLSFIQPGGIGTVRLIITLEDPAGRAHIAYACPIPRTMLPGDRVGIDCVVPLVPAHARGPVLAPGPYTVRVELDQLGVTKFVAKGDHAATVAVTLRS